LKVRQLVETLGSTARRARLWRGRATLGTDSGRTNIKAIEVIPRDAALVTYRIKAKSPVMGKRYGKLIPAIRAALGQSDGSIIAKLAARGELLKLDVEGQTIELAPEALLIETTAAEGFACAEDAGYLVGLDGIDG